MSTRSKNQPFLTQTILPSFYRSPARNSPVASFRELSGPIASFSSTPKSEIMKKSAVASILPWKPVQKLVISLNADESSTTDFEDDAMGEMSKNHGTNVMGSDSMSTEALRAFDNASPASIAMDSPSMAPCSPIDGETSLSASNDANEDSSPPTETAKATDAFQLKLNEYLKQVRAKTDAGTSNDSVKDDKVKAIVPTNRAEKTTIISLKQKTPLVSAMGIAQLFAVFQ